MEPLFTLITLQHFQIPTEQEKISIRLLLAIYFIHLLINDLRLKYCVYPKRNLYHLQNEILSLFTLAIFKIKKEYILRNVGRHRFALVL